MLALTEAGEVYGWGGNDRGQLGGATTEPKSEPVMVSALEGKMLCGISCGASQVCMLCLWLAFLILNGPNPLMVITAMDFISNSIVLSFQSET